MMAISPDLDSRKPYEKYGDVMIPDGIPWEHHGEYGDSRCEDGHYPIGKPMMFLHRNLNGGKTNGFSRNMIYIHGG